MRPDPAVVRRSLVEVSHVLALVLIGAVLLIGWRELWFLTDDAHVMRSQISQPIGVTDVGFGA